MIRWIYSKFEPLVQSAITNRILKFHKALVDRGQIPQATPLRGPTITADYSVADSSSEYLSQYQAEPVRHPRQP